MGYKITLAVFSVATLGLFGPNCAFMRQPESFGELMSLGFDVNITHTLMGGLTMDRVESAARDLIAHTGGKS